MSADTVEVRVARGAALLDAEVPGWWERVRVLRLDMGSTCRCVLGQVFDGEGADGFYAGSRRLRPFVPNWAPVALGFDTSSIDDDGEDVSEDAYEADYRALQAEWTRVIESRRVAS